MNLIKCFMTNSTWYQGAVRNSRPVGILWHDTAGGNPYLKRYVQPYETDSNYSEMMALLGTNKYGNDWNHIVHKAGLNAWIGKLADGSIATMQTGEWEMTPWGCGAGKNGSCNGYIGDYDWQGIHWIQFEICDDGYGNKDYLDKVYKEACELTAYLCDKYNINPNGTVRFNGVEIPTILCHADSYKLGVGGNHGDIYTWFRRYGYDMNTVREDVSKLMNTSTTVAPDLKFEELDVVKIKEDVTTYSNGVDMPLWVRNASLYVRGVNNNIVTISTLSEGAVTGTVFDKDLILVSKAKKPQYSQEVESTQKDCSEDTFIPSDSHDGNTIEVDTHNEYAPVIDNHNPDIDDTYVETHLGDIPTETHNVFPDIDTDTHNGEIPPVESHDPTIKETTPELISPEDQATLGSKFVELINFIVSLIIKIFKK